MKNKYINVHTHQTIENSISESIQNVSGDFDNIKEHGFFSVGLHPWHINALTAKSCFAELALVSQKTNVLAIGECGLDKLCNTNYELQKNWFVKQIEWANHIKKPLIIHCVRAHDEILQLLKSANNKSPVVFHGFNKKLTLASKIIDHGYYLSFGKQLLWGNYSDIFKAIPIERIVFETDDAHVTIDEIYKSAAHIKNITLDILCQKVLNNTICVFGKNFTNLNE